MNEIVKLKSGNPNEELNSYSRLVMAGNIIFVSNTAGRNYKTLELPTDVLGQAIQAFENIEAALAGVGASLKDTVQVKVFVPDLNDKVIVNKLVAEKFRGIDPANTTICTPLGKPELKVEFEITAYRRDRPAEPETRLTI